MPKDRDLKKILIIGAGPIIIGQACEFDYSGTQACKALKEENYEVVLINSNPATIMTDANIADSVYIEPITLEVVTQIIKKERPDAILPTVGGQTALNCVLELDEAGVLEKYAVKLIGADIKVIKKAENRLEFNEAMAKIGLKTVENAIVHSVEEAKAELPRLGLPAIIRPSFTLGGSGGGIAYTEEEYFNIIKRGLNLSPTTEVLVDKSILGWKEYEMEVVRDKNDNVIIVCSIENLDPVGVHTGDSVTIAPSVTLTDKEYQAMRDASIAVLREIGVETGGSNVQFAINPKDGTMVVIEMNPRVSRSSALASKATGFPIAKVASKLAVGYTLDEISNDITKVTPVSFEPTIDYVVIKIPRFDFEKFNVTNPTLSSSMKSVGEVMAIGRSFNESLQKALCSLEDGLSGLNSPKLPQLEGVTDYENIQNIIKDSLFVFAPDRLLRIAEALRYGINIEEIHDITQYDPWFLEHIKKIVEVEDMIIKQGLSYDMHEMLELKKQGFSDQRIAHLTKTKVEEVTKLREDLGLYPVYKSVDTCAAEFESHTSYLYSCYVGDGYNQPECESVISDKKKVIILGGGPNRIGQGIEFDYVCVHASFALREEGIETIMINCNPETVSTDYDVSDKLYFEPLMLENVLNIIKKEQSNGELLGAIVQFGGQTPLKLAMKLKQLGVPILGTAPEKIHLAEDRDEFKEFLQSLNIKQPKNDICYRLADIKNKIDIIGYPVVIRPSYVLGGRAMEIIRTDEELDRYIKKNMNVIEGAILVDKFLDDAIEVDVDALADGENVFIVGIMEHIEEAGIHSGDSACSIPPYSLADSIIEKIKECSIILAKSMNVVGLMNVQYAIKDGEVYVLEVNPRASRTVPFVSKATSIPVAKIATLIMIGKKLSDFNLKYILSEKIAVKEAVFPFSRFAGVDVILGPEMKSTGEVMGVDNSFEIAFAKAQIAAGYKIPEQGTVFVSVKDKDKNHTLVSIVNSLIECGFNIITTKGTAKFLIDNGISKLEIVNKVREGGNHIVNKIEALEVVLVINTTEGSKDIADSFSIRRSSLMQNIMYFTTIAGVKAIVRAIMKIRLTDEFNIYKLK